MTKPESLVVSTLVPVGPAEAWAAYTDPEMIRKWNFASEDWCCPSAEVDLRVGGQHTARMSQKTDPKVSISAAPIPRSKSLRL